MNSFDVFVIKGFTVYIIKNFQGAFINYIYKVHLQSTLVTKYFIPNEFLGLKGRKEKNTFYGLYPYYIIA